MLMFAYGSNTNMAQMAIRCPDSKPLGCICLPGWRLIFRGVADIIQDDRAICWGGVWRITDKCERALDIYEGVRNGMYRKEYITIRQIGKDKMLIYRMNSNGIFPPTEGYLRSIREGYRHFGMPQKAFTTLNNAVQAAWDKKAPSYIERRRHRRNGRPRLAENRNASGRIEPQPH